MEAIVFVIFFLLAMGFIIWYGNKPDESTDPNIYWKAKLYKNIDRYRKSLPISKEDPFKSDKYDSTKILNARKEIEIIKSFWKENKEVMKDLPFMTDELYESTEKELN